MLTMDRLASTKLLRKEDHLIGKFNAMGCACEVLMDTEDEDLGQRLLETAVHEAHRIEKKWSRYRGGNIIDQINNANGDDVWLDMETARLIGFADQGYRLSDGLFDITSGVLRRVWKFDGSECIPDQEKIDALLPYVGWDKVVWDAETIKLRPGMEIDLGGIGKEYAVDRTLTLLGQISDVSVMVNFGGDIAVNHARKNNEAWTVGIENVDHENQPVKMVALKQGAITTSGDSKRYVLINGSRYGHILNPRTGWPVEQTPRSVTVAAPSCSEAGFLSTLGILSGKEAEQVLTSAGAQHWIYR